MTSRQIQLLAAALGLAWIGVLVADPVPEVGPFVLDDLAAAGGIGSALLVLAAPLPGRRPWLAAAVVAIAPLLAAVRTDGWTAAAVLVVMAAWVRLWTSSDPLAFIPAMSAGVYLLRSAPAGVDGAAPVVFAVLAASVAALEIWIGRRVLAGGLAAGAAVGLWGMAAAYLDRPFGPAAGALLLAAAVITVALGRPLAALTAAPGLVAAVAGLLAATDRPATGGDTAAWLALAIAVATTALAAGRPSPPIAWTAGTGLAVALGGWLVLAPSTWGWVQPVGLDPYQEGVAVAAAAGAVVALGVAAIRIRQTRW